MTDDRIEQRVQARIAREGFWRGFLLRRPWSHADVLARIREIRDEEQSSTEGGDAPSAPR